MGSRQANNEAALMSSGKAASSSTNGNPLTHHALSRARRNDLIGYIATLEAKVLDYQHNMGLVILERKEWFSKYEQMKDTAELAEIMYKRDKAAHSSAVAEAKIREDNLKKALEVEKECIANIEKALHEMRAESAETKVVAEIKFAEANIMAEDAQKQLIEAEEKLRTGKSLEAEAKQYHGDAERKLHEVEAREEDLRRQILAFNSEYDAKEKEITLERQSLCERQKCLQEEQERLLAGQALLNQREDYIFSRSQELNRHGKEAEASKARVDEELRALNEEKINLRFNESAYLIREEAVSKREALLIKKEQNLLVLQEKLALKEADWNKKVIANHGSAFELRKSEFEAEMEMRCKAVEDEVQTKRRVWELREMDLRLREDLFLGKDQEVEAKSKRLADIETGMTEKFNSFEEREKNLSVSEKAIELREIVLENEKEEIIKMKVELQKSFDFLDHKMKQVTLAEEKLESMKTETNELSVLQIRLKEEIEMVGYEKLELVAEADKLKADKSKFELEWELIEEKREQLRNETESVAKEREVVVKFLKNERDSLKLEKDAIREKYRHDVDSLNCEREEFMRKMKHDSSELFNEVQQERAGLLRDIETQKMELENRVDGMREDIEIKLSQRERLFELEKEKELQYMSFLKEMVAKESEHVALEMKKVDAERSEITLNRGWREKEWKELNNSIEELKLQREKLKEQRELLHVDREEIRVLIEELKKLEALKALAPNIAVAEILESAPRSSKPQIMEETEVANEPISLSSAAKLSSNYTDVSLRLVEPKCPENGIETAVASVKLDASRESVRSYSFEEPKVILEVPLGNMDVERSASFSETDSLTGTKRRIEDLFSGENIDALEEQMRDNKRSRQQNDFSENELEATANRVIPTQQDEVEDQQMLVSLNQIGGMEETDVLIDATIEVSEATYENIDADNSVVEANIECLVSELDQDIHQNEGTSVLADALQDRNDHLHHGFEIQKEALEVFMADDGHYAKENENQQEAIPDSIQHNNDHGDSESDKSDEVTGELND